MKQRRAFEDGHRRKFLLVVDESKEAESALYYAASRMQRSSGVLVLLHVVSEADDFQHWAGVRQVQLEEETAKAKAVFRLFRRKLTLAGFEDLEVEEVIREGNKAEQIARQIDEDEDITIVVLGASDDKKGPGPLVESLVVGKQVGFLPVPITVVPAHLSLEEIRALA